MTLDDLLWATAYQIALMLKVRVVLLLPEGETVAVRAGYPPEDMLDDADLAAAKWCWQHNRPAGRGADTLPGAKRLFLPMRTGRGPVGVVGLDSDRPGPLLVARSAPPARCAGRPGGARHRAHQSGAGRRPRAPRRPRPSGCARRCSPRSRTICARRSPRSWARRPACGPLSRGARRGGAGRADRARSRRRPSGSTASSPICST